MSDTFLHLDVFFGMCECANAVYSAVASEMVPIFLRCVGHFACSALLQPSPSSVISSETSTSKLLCDKKYSGQNVGCLYEFSWHNRVNCA